MNGDYAPCKTILIPTRGADRTSSMFTPSPRAPAWTEQSTKRGSARETTFMPTRLHPDRADGRHQRHRDPDIAGNSALSEIHPARAGNRPAPGPLHYAFADRSVHAGQAEGAAVAARPGRCRLHQGTS